jgi:hypothetical protein
LHANLKLGWQTLQIILNGVNGRYLRNIVEAAQAEIERGGSVTERVDVAVAYATDEDLLFKWCLKNEIPLRFWGRFDEGVPVSVRILEGFLSRRSPNYSCRLVRHFHPKVIWWRGFGVYIGSANLSQSAWWKNFEAGVFLREEELVASGQDIELDQFFREIDRHASPLTDELFKLIQRRSLELENIRKADSRSASSFLTTDYVQPWEGLNYVSGKKASDKQRDDFLIEWNSTLQILRDLGANVSKSENRPVWVGADAPLGTQADQFLHAHYYQRTFDGRRADYEKYFQRARSNTGKAVGEAIAWWRGLETPPNNEDRTLNEWAPYLREMLAADRLHKISENEFVEIFSRIHATIEYARRVPNKVVGLDDGRPYTMAEKIDALARHIYRRPNAGPPPLETLHYVLYDGPEDELPNRMWNALSDSTRRIDNFGVSALGELIGWALPDRFPPRNGRTSKALRSLGYDVTVHV